MIAPRIVEITFEGILAGQLLMGIRRQVLSGGSTVEEEYWFGNNVTYHAPSEEEFQLPSICEHTASDTDL